MFGEKLKQLRAKHNLTQQDIAKLLKVSPSTVGMYEQGRRNPDTETIKFLADYFGVTTDYLLSRTNKIKSNIQIPEDYARKHPVTKRDIKQYDDFIEQAQTYFMNDEVDVEDKERIFHKITEFFWDAKEKNKKKYGRKKEGK
ncbi:MAG: helix-turn-helix transcriptional regulator [Dehalobacterium sp.]